MNIAHILLIATALCQNPVPSEGGQWGVFVHAPYQATCAHCDKEAEFVETYSLYMEGFLIRQKRFCCENHICRR